MCDLILGARTCHFIPIIALLFVSGHDFVLDPEIHNFITNISSSSGFSPKELSQEEFSNEIEDTKEAQDVITVELPDLAGLSELPKSSGPTKGKPKVTFSIGNEIFDEKKKGFFQQVKEKKEGPSGKKFSFKVRVWALFVC